MTRTTLTVPPEVLEEADIDLEAILQFTAVEGKITIEQLGTRRCVGCPDSDSCPHCRGGSCCTGDKNGE